MKNFEFIGEISSSKSYFNRALILWYYKKSLKIVGETQSRDVVFLKKALQDLKSTLEVGEGGTTLRFLSFLVSRVPGKWTLTGSQRLFSRPQTEIENLLEQLGVRAEASEKSLVIHSSGWRETKMLDVDLSISSQFASGIILNAWDLPFDLTLNLSQDRVSDGYLDMTLDLVKKAGMSLQVDHSQITIPAYQKIKISEIEVEPDVSSAFVVASLAAARGDCEIQKFPFQSIQPDVDFLSFFKKMNVPWEREGKNLIVHRAFDMKPIEVSLRDCPDLFPVLCVLLTKAIGTSKIFDTPQLVHKESNRLVKTGELLRFMKVKHEIQSDGIIIHSEGHHHHEFFEFDPDEDHRLAFAGALAKSMGYRMKIKNPEVVNKSFPGFWDLIGGGPG